MMKFLRTIVPLVAGLAMLPLSSNAQTVSIAKGGSLTVSLAANVTQAFSSQGITVTYTGTGRRGDSFNVSRGAVNESTGSGSAISQGGMTFSEGGNTVALNSFQLLGSSPNSYITADVVINGTDKGRFPVFLLAANLYQAPLTSGPYNSGPVQFSINPQFQPEFADYMPINGLAPSAPLGSFILNVTINKN